MNSESSASDPLAPHGLSRRALLTAGVGVAAGLAFAGGGVGVGGIGAQRASAAPPWWAKLSPRQQAGQRIVFSYPGATPPQSLLDAIAAGTVGGVIFFGENILSLSQIADVVAQLRAAQASSPVSEPLLFMTDQEGGLIRRLRGQQPVLSEKQIGLSADPDAAATAAGSGAAAALRGVGMNLNLAPVLDVFRTPGNFDDQFQRSYSSDPLLAGRLGADFVRAQQGAGVAATSKHFPGLGAASAAENTDLGPVTLTQSLEELRSVDEDAFAPAIAAGVQLVMTSWAIYPAIDPVYPAGLSRTIVQGELRDRLGFGGVTITDALEAGSLAAFGDTGQRALLSAQAGMDLLLCSGRDMEQGFDALDAITAAVTDKTLNPGHFKQSLSRVRELRASLF
jgi:beta-N-acetylhexosaminidase